MKHAAYEVDLVNEQGLPIGTKTRQEIQKATDLYHTIFVLLNTPEGRLLLTEIPERTDLPNMYPGLLGVTVATIRRHLETPDQAASRAVAKEVYIEDLPLTKMGDHYTELPDGRRQYISLYSGVHAMPEEYSHTDISNLQAFTPDEITKNLATEPQRFAPAFVDIWQRYMIS